MRRDMTVSGTERNFPDDGVIVSKTDLQGRITYVNRLFMDISGYSERELLGQAHSIIRHPDMPRSVFRLFWEALQAGREVFAYVVNRCKNGDHYWVLAHATPSYDLSGAVAGYHSNRRVPDPRIVREVIVPLYRQLRDEESRAEDRKEGLRRGQAMLTAMLDSKELDYDRWVFSL